VYKRQTTMSMTKATAIPIFHENANLVELTLPDNSPRVGDRIRDISMPGDAVLVAIIRDGQGRAPEREAALEAGDELLFMISPNYEPDLVDLLAPR
ncbi:hypothetical protein K1Y80_55310, partial [Streptomyces sp. MAG02]|nr:hypothetical protein [Streptomyces sp. MAG02]